MIVTEYRRSFPNVQGNYWIKLLKVADGSWLISAIENIEGDLMRLKNLNTYTTEQGALKAAESLFINRLSQIAKEATVRPEPLRSVENRNTPTRSAPE